MHKNQSHQHNYFWTIVPRKNPMRENRCSRGGILLIFSSNHFYRKIYTDIGRKHLRLFSETFWHPRELPFSTALALRHSVWLWPLYASPFALSLRVLASPLLSSLTAANSPLFLHPATLPLKSISFSLRIDFPWETEYLLVYLQLTLKPSLILFLLNLHRLSLSP